MKKRLLLILAILVIINPIKCLAISKDYVDKVADIVTTYKE